MADKTQDLYLQQGKTQPLVLRCETDVIAYKAISAIAQTAPVRITAVGHGMVNGWRGAVTNAKGMTEINGEANALRSSDYHPVTVVDADTVEFNDVDASGFKTWTAGGYLQYNTPMDLTSYAARLQIRNKKNGDTVLLEMTSANGLIAIDTALKTVTIYLDAIDFTALTWKKGYYELELYKDVTRTRLNPATTLVESFTFESVYSPLEGNVFLDVETTK